MKNLPLLALAGSLCLLLHACGESYFYQEKKTIAKTGWAYQDTLVFAFNIPDTTRIYDLSLDLNHSTDYPSQNIYVQAVTTLPNDSSIQQRFSFELADPSGKWRGKGSGKSRTFSQSIQERAYFKQAGNYRIAFIQHLRVSPVVGINSLAFKIKESKEQR